MVVFLFIHFFWNTYNEKYKGQLYVLTRCKEIFLMAQIMQEWANSLNLKEFYKEMARMRKSSLKKNIPEGNNMVKVIDYTEQLMKFIQFFPADDQGEYSISLRDVTNSNKVSYIPRKFTSEQFRKAIGWLAVQNSKGYNVYFRVPNDPHYIVIDDILDDSKEIGRAHV